MIKVKDAPVGLQPYLFHGVDLTWSGTNDAEGTCPFCGKERHFFVNQTTGLYTCKVCAEGNEKGGGNVYVFLDRFWRFCLEYNYDPDLLDELAQERGLKRRTLIEWGVARSTLKDQWLIPGFNQDKKINNLYRRAYIEGRWRELGTPTCNHGVFGLQLWEDEKQDAAICEGCWDGMALWEVLNSHREEGGKFYRSTNTDLVLGKNKNVAALPGCEQFRTQWIPRFKGKNVTLLFDSDHPRQHPTIPDKIIEPIGYKGMQKTVGMLHGNAKSLKIVDWGPEGYAPEKPTGYDVRDTYRDQGAIGVLQLPVTSPPEDWLTEAAVVKVNSEPKLEPIYCNSYRDLIMCWRKALKWTDAMDRTFSVMLASCASTDFPGDQLWIRVIGPPGSAKSTLCEAISNCAEFTFPTSVQRGFHSGYVGKSEDAGQDASLIPMIDGKTVIIKDGDTLLTSPARDQILGELRDIYDRVTRAHYKNRKHSIYTDLSVTFILAGTRSLRKLNKAFLGDRFIDTVIYDRAQHQDPALESEILMRAGFSSLRNFKNDEKQENKMDERLMEAVRMTSGYVEWLRNNAKIVAGKIHCPESVVHTCVKLGDLVSHMRARQDKDAEEEDDEVELATRLTSQFVRLANCVAIVMNKSEVDQEVMQRVIHVAGDTSRGNHLTATKILYKEKDGMHVRLLSVKMRKSDPHVRKVLQFMHSIGMVRPDLTEKKNGAKNVNRHVWHLTPKIRSLYRLLAEAQAQQQKEAHAKASQ